VRALRPLQVRRRRRRRGSGVGAAAAGSVGGGRGDVHVLRALRVLPRPAARRRRPGRRRRAVRVPVAAGVRRALGRHRRAPARPALPLPLPAATLRRRRRLPRDDAPRGRRRRPVVPLRQRRPASRPPPRTEGTAGVGEFQRVVACVVYTPRGLQAEIARRAHAHHAADERYQICRRLLLGDEYQLYFSAGVRRPERRICLCITQSCCIEETSSF